MATTQEVRKPRSRFVRGVYLALGLLCLGLAYMSWLPGIPTFDFVILAAFFFARSSDRFHSWLVTHPVFGRIIRGYRSDGFTVRTKAVASAAVVASLVFSMTVLVDSVPLRLVLAAVGLFAVWFIWTRPTKRIASQ
ncbi:MAG TPA: YbaN family protein [Acidimicrobiia bacterium]|nr:YbaN family protein [Acidimicrobiia bacterium]